MKASFTFECTRCGACCSEEGFVFFSKSEIDSCAKALGLTSKEFVSKYLKKDSFGYSHEVRKGDNCCFLKDNKCIINDVKPEQCRSFPFWPEYIGKKGELVNFRRPCRGIFSHTSD